MKKNENGFGVVEGLLVLVILGLIGFVSWYVWHNKATKPISSPTASTPATKTTTTAPTKTVDLNAGYLVMKEWGLRFKAPSGLSDVKYVIHDDTAAFFAKPTGSSVQYRSDFDKFADGNFQYATGVLYRSTDSTKNRSDTTVQGKKLGDYYYYTAWAFNGLATGAACVGLYGDSNSSNCQQESAAFQLVNQGDNALLNTIQLAQ